LWHAERPRFLLANAKPQVDTLIKRPVFPNAANSHASEGVSPVCSINAVVMIRPEKSKHISAEEAFRKPVPFAISLKVTRCLNGHPFSCCNSIPSFCKSDSRAFRPVTDCHFNLENMPRCFEMFQVRSHVRACCRGLAFVFA
jgi:hypothetical protein